MKALAQNKPMQPAIDDRQAFVDAMSCTANNVCIVASDGPGGRCGLTISSMVSVSAEPPMLLICVNRKSLAHNVILANGSFSLMALSASQQELADDFSGRSKRGQNYIFNPKEWHNNGVENPVLRSANAIFECKTTRPVATGTHTLFIAEVLHSSCNSGAPLLYSSRRYTRPAPIKQGTKVVLEAIVSAIENPKMNKLKGSTK